MNQTIKQNKQIKNIKISKQMNKQAELTKKKKNKKKQKKKKTKQTFNCYNQSCHNIVCVCYEVYNECLSWVIKQLFQTFLCNSHNYHPSELWMTR